MNWNKNRQSSHGTAVTKQHSIPFSTCCAHNSSLGNSLIAVTAVGVKHFSTGIRTCKRITYITSLRTSRIVPLAVMDKKQIIFPIDFVPMGSLITKIHFIQVLNQKFM